MRRHAALIPISREHHPMLLLAQLLKKNAPAYRGLPDTLEGKANYAWDLYQQTIDAHFSREEAQLIPHLSGLSADIQALHQEIIAEHKSLRNLFLQLPSQPYTPDTLDELGRQLERHIRKEERIWFQEIQAQLGAEKLENLGRLIGTVD